MIARWRIVFGTTFARIEARGAGGFVHHGGSVTILRLRRVESHLLFPRCHYFVSARSVQLLLQPRYPSQSVISPAKPRIPGVNPAFSLIEMIAVIAILVTLMTAGVGLLSGTGAQARKSGTDMLTGLIEQARTQAITSRSLVVLAIAEPGDLPAGDERCRIGLFKVDGDWPDASSKPSPLRCTLMSRWQSLTSGVALIPGEVDGVANPIDQPKITISYGGAKNLSVNAYAIVFNSRGRLHYPAGSTPVAIRIAEGGYRGGKATPNTRGDSKSISENRLKIGRVTARPYRIDG